MKYDAIIGVRRRIAQVRIAQLLVVIGFVMALGGSGGTVWAQSSSESEVSLLEDQLAAGIQALDADQGVRAESLFAEAYRVDPGYVSPQHGAAAYWLGTACAQQGESGHARKAWIEGQEAVTTAGAFDVRLADAYLQALLATGLEGQRLEAANVYLQLLRHADASLTPVEAKVVRRYAAQTALLMTEETRARIGDGSVHDTSWTLNDDAGSFLRAWWNRHDVAPATPENERLEEHLERLAVAQSKYAYEERPTGLDDRGETYVRYGAPFRQRSITYNDAGFFLDVFRFGVNVASFDFPENEIWTYPHIHHAAYFVFVKKNGLFRIGSSAELIPSRLRTTFSNSERHLNRAVSSLAAMRYIYRHLALYHPDFSRLYNEVENYASWQEMNAAAYKATGEAPPGTTVRTVGAGVNQKRAVFASPVFGIEMPSRFVQWTANQQEVVDAHARRLRRKTMPPQHSQLFAGMDSLVLSVRTARFLEPDGRTRTEVYWGTASRYLHLPKDDTDKASLVKLTAVQYDRDYNRSDMSHRWYNTTPAEEEMGLVVPNHFETWSTANVYHLGLQWEQYAGTLSAERVQLNEQLRMARRHVDTLRALHTEEHRLEMSDLEPLLPRQDFNLGAPNASEASTPYPFERIASDASLLLYFELYHLGFNDEGRTHYTVAYDVLRRTERGGIAQLFRGDDEQRTTTSTTYEGDSRTAREQILIDLSEWERKKPGKLIVTVRVTDEITGQQIERAISFDVAQKVGS